MDMYEITASLSEPLFRGDAALGCITAVCAATDLCCGKVFNMVTVPGLVLGIVFRAEHNGAAGILEVLCAAGFTVLVLFPFYSLGGIGAGDIKLLAAVSAFIPEEKNMFGLDTMTESATWGRDLIIFAEMEDSSIRHSSSRER